MRAISWRPRSVRRSSTSLTSRSNRASGLYAVFMPGEYQNWSPRMHTMKWQLPHNSLFAILLRSPWWASALVGAGVLAAGTVFLPTGFAAFAALPFWAIAAVAGWRQPRAPSAAQVAAGGPRAEEGREGDIRRSQALEGDARRDRAPARAGSPAPRARGAGVRLRHGRGGERAGAHVRCGEECPAARRRGVGKAPRLSALAHRRACRGGRTMAAGKPGTRYDAQTDSFGMDPDGDPAGCARRLGYGGRAGKGRRLQRCRHHRARDHR